MIFKDSEAPQNYPSSVKALERYFNKVHLRRAPSAHAHAETFSFPQAVEMVRQRQSKNIPASPMSPWPSPSPTWTAATYRWTTGHFDPGELEWLPESHEFFTFLNTTGFARAVAEHLFTPEEAAVLRAQPNLNSRKPFWAQQLDRALAHLLISSRKL